MRLKFLLPFAILGFASTAEAASFDCRDIETVDEAIICDRGGLSRLDRQMNAMYQRALRNAPRGVAWRIRQRQRIWLASRRSCRSDIPCIRQHYRQRIGELSRWDD